MAEKMDKKSLTIVIIAIVAIIVVLIVGFSVFKIAKSNSWKDAKSAEDIVISDKDSNEVKIEKLQKKIELLNGDIEKIQLELNPELEKLNTLYEEYVSTMNELQPAATEEPAEEPAD